MKTTFTTKWRKSKQPRKQRKYNANAPKHLKGKLLTAKLSKTLIEKHKIKRTRIRKDDKVKVLRGNFKGKEGKVEQVKLKTSRVMITGIEINKKDGSKARPMIHASNLSITELNTNDKKRLKEAKK